MKSIRTSYLTTRSVQTGMTLIEVLVALAILGLVFILTSSGIVQGLTVNRLQQDATNTQSKLRRITEVVSQELRSAVLGGVADFPVTSDSDGISFVLLSGGGGVTVLPRPGADWGNAENTLVHATDSTALQALVGKPAIMISGSGDALVINQVSSATSERVRHPGCKISMDYDPATRLYGIRTIGFTYDSNTQTLYQRIFDSTEVEELPFAFGLTEFSVGYEYTSRDETRLLSAPYRVDGNPQPTFKDGGDEFELSRLRLTLASGDDGGVIHEHVAYVELTGLGNSARPLSSITPCDDVGGGSGGEYGDPGDDDDGNEDDHGGDDEEDDDDEEEDDEENDPAPSCHWLARALGLC